MRTTVVLFFLLALVATASGQRGIRLTSRFSKRQKFIAEGTRVIYQYTNANHPLYVSYTRYAQPVYHGISGIGTLKIVNDSTIRVDDEVIRTKDLMLFGPRKKGAWVGSTLLVFGGFATIISGKTTGENGLVSFDAAAVTLGFAMEIAGLADVINRFPKSTAVWRVEVVK